MAANNNLAVTLLPVIKMIDLHADDDDNGDDEFHMIVAAALSLTKQRKNIVKINGYFENVNIYCVFITLLLQIFVSYNL